MTKCRTVFLVRPAVPSTTKFMRVCPSARPSGASSSLCCRSFKSRGRRPLTLMCSRLPENYKVWSLALRQVRTVVFGLLAPWELQRLGVTNGYVLSVQLCFGQIVLLKLLMSERHVISLKILWSARGRQGYAFGSGVRGLCEARR